MVEGKSTVDILVPVESDPVSQINHAPTLISIASLSGSREDTPFTITYEALQAAADEADVDGNPLRFRIESVQAGTLTLNGAAVLVGATALQPSQSLVWMPEAHRPGKCI